MADQDVAVGESRAAPVHDAFGKAPWPKAGFRVGIDERSPVNNLDSFGRKANDQQLAVTGIQTASGNASTNCPELVQMTRRTVRNVKKEIGREGIRQLKP